MKKLLLVFPVLLCCHVYGQKSYQRELPYEDPCSGTGLNDQFSPTEFQVYPNPGRETVNMTLPANGRAVLTDIKGVIVRESEVGPREKWDLSALSAGVYFLSLFTQDQLYRTKLILDR